ncbi:MAG: transcription termination/antitermination NusG family protein [Chthoniobacter sp.]|uniref:transcription termination/antitermination protein NusG n=1 Tax=Chthoniobacter sp. TaxID=2510640 RepID=UPI0032A4C7C2
MRSESPITVESSSLEERWYCLRSQPKHEHIAAAHLRQYEEIEVFCPRVKIQRSTRRGLVWFTEALFPNYLFARFAMTRWHARVRSCQGVSGIVRFGDDVPAIPDRALDDLRAYMQDSELKTVSFSIVEGDDVEIVEGPFRGQTGVVKHLLPARERVKILLEVLGGATEVNLPLTAIFKEAPLLI